MIEALLPAAVAGIVAGTLAGLLGIGGGLVIVPALVWTFSSLDFPPSLLMQSAIATSLATILFTGAGSVAAHQRVGAVRWDLVAALAPALVVGALLGSQVAHRLDSTLLMRLFGVFAALLAVQMIRGGRAGAPATEERRVSLPVHLAGGGVIGIASAFFGIGGGSLTVPYLAGLGVRMQQAVATSAACGIPIAAAGAGGFIIAGWSRADLPPFALGYVHLPSLAAIVLTSVPMTQLGARLAHRLPASTLKRVFGLVLLAVAADFLFYRHG